MGGWVPVGTRHFVLIFHAPWFVERSLKIGVNCEFGLFQFGQCGKPLSGLTLAYFPEFASLCAPYSDWYPYAYMLPYVRVCTAQ